MATDAVGSVGLSVCRASRLPYHRATDSYQGMGSAVNSRRPLIGEAAQQPPSLSVDLFVDHNDIDLLNRVGLHHNSGE